jgi:uncharacterized protein YjbI with pentapeptide repeats
VANEEHLKLLQQGVDVWNAWREKEKGPFVPDLTYANLTGANLTGPNLFGANLSGANFAGAILGGANLKYADLTSANFAGASLREVALVHANLLWANLTETDLSGADLNVTTLAKADLTGANLTGADLTGANLFRANLTRAKLVGANLAWAQLTKANLVDAVITGCRIYGISAWDVKVSEGTTQQSLIITWDQPDVTVDNLEVAQFIHLLLHNEKLRDVIDTVGKKGVLLLGRFTDGRIAVLERLREELRKRGYLPIVFNFNKPETKDFTETVRLLAGLSKFVIADITNPKSAPLELQATVPEIMVPFRPIIEEGEKPFAMLQDLWIKHRDWVFEPIYYSSVDALIASLDEKIIRPAEQRFVELLARKAETMKGEHV